MHLFRQDKSSRSQDYCDAVLLIKLDLKSFYVGAIAGVCLKCSGICQLYFARKGLRMDRLEKFFDYTLRYALEPGLNWVIAHPIISVIVVFVLVYWSVRGYRML